MPKYKIIATSNLDDESVSDVLVCDSIDNLIYGNAIVEMLNLKFASDTSRYYFIIKLQEYMLYRFQP